MVIRSGTKKYWWECSTGWLMADCSVTHPQLIKPSNGLLQQWHWRNPERQKLLNGSELLMLPVHFRQHYSFKSGLLSETERLWSPGRGEGVCGSAQQPWPVRLLFGTAWLCCTRRPRWTRGRSRWRWGWLPGCWTQWCSATQTGRA